MPETPESQPAPPGGAAPGSGCVVFLIDESTAMDVRVAGGTKSKAQSIATALNSLLGQLAAGPAVDVALVGYRVQSDGGPDVGSRWAGTLAGREWVSSAELAAAPLVVESRVRKVPGSGGVGVACRQSVPFPVWYVPKLAEPAPRTAAFDHCRRVLSNWLSAAVPNPKPPMIVSFVGELPEEEPAQDPGKTFEDLTSPSGPPLLLHAHLGVSGRVPATLYPSSDTHLPPGPVRALFHETGPLPEPLLAALRESHVTVNAGARGLVYNAKMADLIRLLSLVKTYAAYQPLAAEAPAAASAMETTPATVAADQETVTSATSPGAATGKPKHELPTTEDSQAVEKTPAASADEVASGLVPEPVLLVLLLDRSVEDPACETPNVWQRLQDHANEILAQIAKRPEAPIHVAVVSYGRDKDPGAQESPEAVRVESRFAGPLAPETVVSAGRLARGALRTEEVTEKVSNGIGGLVEVTRKKSVFVDLEPTGSVASPAPAFAAIKTLLAGWRQEHPGARIPAVILHATRGRFEPGQVEEAAAGLRDIGDVALYHLVVTESPHPSLAYVPDAARIQDAGIRKLWELSSPLLGRQTLADKRPAVSAESRGFVVNAKFDLLLDGIEAAQESWQGEPPDRSKEA